MPDEHARLSPSASERWISCPASVRLIEKLPRQPGSTYAREGTLAHSMGELKARTVFQGKPSLKELRALARTVEAEGYDLADMSIHTDAYVELLKDLRAEAGPGSVVLLEQRVNTGVPLCWGTSDAVIVGERKLIICDLKYGQGVPVDAYENPQGMLYGVGSLETIADMLSEIETVVIVIFQPRLGSTSRFEISAADLRAWRDSLLPVVEEALHSPDPAFGPSDSACRWCPLAGECRARMEWATHRDFSTHPDLLSPDELGNLLGDLPGIAKWINSVKEVAMRKAYAEGTEIPGWKVVRAAGRRTIPKANQPHAVQHAIDSGWNAEDVAEFHTKPIGELEKKLGARFDEVMGPFITKSEGSPSLVRDSDKRPAINSAGEAAKEFSVHPIDPDAS